MTLRERARQIKLKLSGLRDPVLTDFLPGAGRVADETEALINDLLAHVPESAE